MTTTRVEKFLARVNSFTARSALNAGLSPRELYHLRDSGVIVEISRGIFRKSDAPPTAYVSLLAVSRRIPRGVVCATSALAFWDLTDELPAHVHIAVPRGVRPPRVREPATRIHVFAEATFALRRTQQPVSELEQIPIYAADRSVVDALRLRNRLGRDIAFEALRRYLQTKEANPAELMRLARKLRVGTPMASALELLVR